MKGNKLAQLLNARIRVTLLDGRVIIGQLLAHDKHFNLVLCECEEFRLPRGKSKNKNINGNNDNNNNNDNDSTFKRTLGMIVLRGEEVVSVTAESGAPPRGGNRARVPASVISDAVPVAAAAASTGGFAVPAPGTGLTGPGVKL